MRGRFLYRVKRQRAAASAAILLALVVVAGSAVSAQSRATIGSTLEDNGRGSYDLLVTAGTGVLSSGTGTAGLVEQNFAALTGAGQLTLGQLSSIRHISGVDVAAPLAFVGDLTSPAYGVLVGARDPDGAVDGFFAVQPRAFDVQVELTTSDGVQTQVLSAAQVTMAVSRAGTGPLAAAILAATGVESANTANLSADVTIPGVPELASGLVAVDPIAEQQLLEATGSFLLPLAAWDEQVRAEANNATLSRLVPDPYSYERDTVASSGADVAAVPVVISDSAYAPINATVSVTPIDISGATASEFFTSTAPGLTALSASGQDLVRIGQRGPTTTTTVDLQQRVVPFAQPFLSIPLPGASAGPDGAAYTTTPSLVPRLVAPAPYSSASATEAADAPAGTAERLAAQPQGFEILASGAREQTYRPETEPEPETNAGYVFAPVGGYSPGDVTGREQEASYVPLGTYAPGSAIVTQVGPHEGAVLGPSFSGRGLELSAPGAITTLSGLQAVRPDAGVDVVRVRVVGPRTYTASSRSQIEEVAARIAELGLRVRIVAGSSLTPIGVYVPDFFAQPQADAGTDLGWIGQEWTSLGAAVQVERASLGAAAWLLGISLFAVGVLSGVVQGVAVDGRRREATLLRQLGWQRRRVFSWFLAEGLLGVVLVAAGAAVALAFNAGNPFAVLASVTSVGLTILLVVIGAYFGARTGAAVPSLREPRPAAQARSSRAVGSRIVAARPIGVNVTALALVILALSAVAFTGVAISSREEAGGSRLSDLVDAKLLLSQTMMTALALVAGCVLFVIGTGQLRRTITPQLQMLVTNGWSGHELAVLLRATVIRPASLGLVVGSLAAVSLGIALDRENWWRLAAPAPAVMVIVSALALVSATRSAHAISETTPAGQHPRGAHSHVRGKSAG